MSVDAPTYHDRPVLKEPVWIWSVPAYFFAGGAGGAAAALGAAVRLTRRRDLARLERRARWVATAGGATGTALLIHDLGRPERFLNMLRVFRATSPMSVGSWVLAAETGAATTAALLEDRPGVAGWLGNAAGLASGALGLPLAAYTSVLLSTTAVPLWQAVRRSLPHLFAASAVSAGADVLSLFDLDEAEECVVRRFGVAGKGAQFLATAAVEREAGTTPEVGRHLHAGVGGSLWRAARVLTAAGLAVGLTSRGSSRRRRLGAGLGIAGGVALRFAVFHAGRASARDPRATFAQQRVGRLPSAAAG